MLCALLREDDKGLKDNEETFVNKAVDDIHQKL